MINEKLHKIQTPAYWNAGSYTLNQIGPAVKQNFEARIITLYNLSQDKGFIEPVIEKQKDLYEKGIQYLKKAIYTKNFYTAFYDFGVKFCFNKNVFPMFNFNVSPKNITFTTEISAMELISHFDNMSTTPKTSLDHPIILKDIPNYQDLFGKGDFPNIVLYTFRLGNTEYFAYTITR